MAQEPKKPEKRKNGRGTGRGSPGPAPPEPLERIRAALRELKLTHIAATLDEQWLRWTQDGAAPEVLLQRLLDEECRMRQERRIDRLVRDAKFPEHKLLVDFVFEYQPSLDKNLIMQLATGTFIKHGQGILFGGQSGTGKSFLAKAIGLCATKLGYGVRYTTAADMIKDLFSGLADDSVDRKLKRYLMPALLGIDEVGCDRREQENARNASLFFKVVDGRYRRVASTVITTNVDFEALGHYLGDPLITTSIADRMLHHSIVISIDGPSWRLKESEELNRATKQDLQKALRALGSAGKTQHTAATGDDPENSPSPPSGPQPSRRATAVTPPPRKRAERPRARTRRRRPRRPTR
jgi:DNA replication protein DnaC